MKVLNLEMECDWMEQKYYFEACQSCNRLKDCSFAARKDSDPPAKVWSCDMFRWDESKLQSQQNHAPDKIGGLDKSERGQALGCDSGSESDLL